MGFKHGISKHLEGAVLLKGLRGLSLKLLVAVLIQR